MAFDGIFLYLVKNEITEKTFIQESVFSLGLVKFIITDDKIY